MLVRGDRLLLRGSRRRVALRRGKRTQLRPRLGGESLATIPPGALRRPERERALNQPPEPPPVHGKVGMTIAAVIPARNATETVGAAVRSARHQDRRPDRVLVVDD